MEKIYLLDEFFNEDSDSLEKVDSNFENLQYSREFSQTKDRFIAVAIDNYEDLKVLTKWRDYRYQMVRRVKLGKTLLMKIVEEQNLILFRIY